MRFDCKSNLFWGQKLTMIRKILDRIYESFLLFSIAKQHSANKKTHGILLETKVCIHNWRTLITSKKTWPSIVYVYIALDKKLCLDFDTRNWSISNSRCKHKLIHHQNKFLSRLKRWRSFRLIIVLWN